MRKSAIAILSVFLFIAPAWAVDVELTLEAFSPATLPTVSKTVDIPDPNDQVEVARQAALLALSSDGWDFASLGGAMEFREPPDWTGSYYFVRIPADVAATFGYFVDLSSLSPGAGYLLYFHTDEFASRGSHNICETADNYGVISGGSDGALQQCFVADWGQFSLTLGPGEAEGGLLDLHPDNFEVKVNPGKAPQEPTGQYLTAYIDPPDGHTANEIDVSTVELSVNGTSLAMAETPAIVDNVLVVLFELNLTNVADILGLDPVQVNVTGNTNRVRVTATAPPTVPIELVEMNLTGELTGGETFGVVDTIRVEME